MVYITRFMYRASIRDIEEEVVLNAANKTASYIKGLVKKGEIMASNLFRLNSNLFAYYECTGRIYLPEELFHAMDFALCDWPGEEEPRKWIPMTDIYHCTEPVSVEQWKRKHPVKSSTANLMRLKPEMVSSYIFYHWQYQEEKPGGWCKYCAIYLHENLTIIIGEDPDPPEVPPYKGRLNTSNTPDNWDELMFSHCIPWDDVTDEKQKMWRKIELIWSIYLN